LSFLALWLPIDSLPLESLLRLLLGFNSSRLIFFCDLVVSSEYFSFDVFLLKFIDKLVVVELLVCGVVAVVASLVLQMHEGERGGVFGSLVVERLEDFLHMFQRMPLHCFWLLLRLVVVLNKNLKNLPDFWRVAETFGSNSVVQQVIEYIRLVFPDRGFLDIQRVPIRNFNLVEHQLLRYLFNALVGYRALQTVLYLQVVVEGHALQCFLYQL
jgi:hypothetical protein